VTTVVSPIGAAHYGGFKTGSSESPLNLTESPNARPGSGLRSDVPDSVQE
jgi:hypothetical protein